jgi:hypothetical protein
MRYNTKSLIRANRKRLKENEETPVTRLVATTLLAYNPMLKNEVKGKTIRSVHPAPRKGGKEGKCRK